ncbi:MAG TPA: hypothetical protein VGD39_10665 [Nocardioides sp.]
MEVSITGGRALLEVARALKKVGDTGLGKEMGKALRDASRELRPAIKTSAAQLMPHSGGYAAVLSTSLRFRQTVHTTRHTARVIYKVHADGRHERRDVPNLNRGRLRKPLYGNRAHWFDQRIRPGFVDRPVDRAAPEVARRMQAVVRYVADQIGA